MIGDSVESEVSQGTSKMRKTLRWFFLGIGLLSLGNVACLAQGSPAPTGSAGPGKPAGTAKRPEKATTDKPLEAQPVAPQRVVLPEPPVPVQQIQQLGITQCLDVVSKMSRETLDRKYDVQSGWNREAPALHAFQSVAILNNPQTTPQSGLAALVATPTPGGSCDGVALQVFPLASDCPTVQKLMQGTGSTSRPIMDAQIMFDRAGKRLFLLPGFAKTCIAVAVDSTFGEPGK